MTAGVEKPWPISLTCQSSFGPSLGHSCNRLVSFEMPSRCGPRHCGQSAACSAVAERRQMPATKSE